MPRFLQILLQQGYGLQILVHRQKSLILREFWRQNPLTPIMTMAVRTCVNDEAIVAHHVVLLHVLVHRSTPRFCNNMSVSVGLHVDMLPVHYNIHGNTVRNLASQNSTSSTINHFGPAGRVQSTSRLNAQCWLFLQKCLVLRRHGKT